MFFRSPHALSSALVTLGLLQPQALGFLNLIDPLDSVSIFFCQYQLSSYMSAVSLYHCWSELRDGRDIRRTNKMCIMSEIPHVLLVV